MSQNTGRISASRAIVFRLLEIVYLILIFGLPLLLCIEANAASSGYFKYLTLLVTPLLYTVMFAATAGLLSRPHQRGVVAGRFPRDVGHSVYFHRRLYGLCWTSLFYFKPVYHLVLTVNGLRRLIFRLFGYKGQLDFTIYPDVWVRDLPLLDFGKGSYIANRASLGTNICTQDGEIIVGRISLGARSVVGHYAGIGLGTKIGADSEIGIGAMVGLRTRIGDRTKIGAQADLNHGCSIGADCEVGPNCYVGLGAKVGDVTYLPGGTIRPDRVTRRPQNSSDFTRFS